MVVGGEHGSKSHLNREILVLGPTYTGCLNENGDKKGLFRRKNLVSHLRLIIMVMDFIAIYLMICTSLQIISCQPQLSELI